ncbi:MAG: TolC family protein [Chitinispirillaceae bacterium]|nr:TolC family protein [Chitinispirillaceae bacterium]
MGTHPSGKRRSLLLTAVLFLVCPLVAQSPGAAVELSSSRAVEMAMKNNRTVRAIGHQLRAADFGVKSAVTSFLPHATASGRYTRQSVNEMFEMILRSTGHDLDLENSYNFGLEITQPLFTGFATLNSLRSAQASRSLQESTGEKTAHMMKYAVLQIYWGLVALEKSQVVAGEAIRQLEELTSSQAAMMDQGMATEHDYLLTRASLAQARMNELKAGAAIRSMKRQFAVLLGLPVDTAIVLTDTAAVKTVPGNNGVDSVIAAALRDRPDMRESALQLHLSELGVKLARASYFPVLAAGFSLTESRPDQRYQDQWGNSWYAYAALRFDLLDWGDRVFKVRRAKEQYRSLFELSEQKKASVEKEAADACDAVRQSSEELATAALLVEAREKAYNASLAKHEEGVMPMYELLNAHSAFVTAKYQALQAATNLELAVVNMEMGGLGTSAGD